jgi:WD40 repeat protein
MPATHGGKTAIRDAATGRELLTTADATYGTPRVAFSPDGRYAAVPVTAGARVLDLAAGTELRALRKEGAHVANVAWSEDSRRIFAVGVFCAVDTWDVEEGRLVSTVPPPSRVRGAAVGPGARLVATQAPSAADFEVIELATGRLVGAFSRRLAALRSIAWSPDGRRIAWLEEDGPVCVSEVEPPRDLGVIDAGGVTGMAFSPDGRRLATVQRRGDGVVRIWEIGSSACALVLPGNTAGLHAVAWSPDGRLVAALGSEARVRIWDLEAVARFLAVRPAALEAEVARMTGIRIDGFEVVRAP